MCLRDGRRLHASPYGIRTKRLSGRRTPLYFVLNSRKTVESDLEEENLQLRNQIDEMETFLADYGLVWVGSNRSDSDSDSEELEKTDSEYDWDKIIRNVKERVSIN